MTLHIIKKWKSDHFCRCSFFLLGVKGWPNNVGANWFSSQSQPATQHDESARGEEQGRRFFSSKWPFVIPIHGLMHYEKVRVVPHHLLREYIIILLLRIYKLQKYVLLICSRDYCQNMDGVRWFSVGHLYFARFVWLHF